MVGKADVAHATVEQRVFNRQRRQHRRLLLRHEDLVEHANRLKVAVLVNLLNRAWPDKLPRHHARQHQHRGVVKACIVESCG